MVCVPAGSPLTWKDAPVERFPLIEDRQLYPIIVPPLPVPTNVIVFPCWAGFGVIDVIVATGGGLGRLTVNRKLPLLAPWVVSPG